MTIKYWVIFCVMLLNFSVYGQSVTSKRANITTSIIVPCCAKHAQHLFSLLKMLENQTVLPDEVVISLSDAHQVPAPIINALKNESWRFPVQLLLFNEKLYAGENRNEACNVAMGDVFICQDADDIPHPQRVEIIKHYFQEYHLDHLAHQWFELKNGEKATFKHYELRKIPVVYPRSLKEFRDCHITNGNIAIARHVFDKLKWSSKPRGQDTEFNNKIYSSVFKKRMAVKIPLLAYRIYLSSSVA